MELVLSLSNGPPPSRTTDVSGELALSAVEGSRNANGANGDLPPTDKQISYLWRLGMKNNLTEQEIGERLRTVQTRAEASKLIVGMRQSAT